MAIEGGQGRGSVGTPPAPRRETGAERAVVPPRHRAARAFLGVTVVASGAGIGWVVWAAWWATVAAGQAAARDGLDTGFTAAGLTPVWIGTLTGSAVALALILLGIGGIAAALRRRTPAPGAAAARATQASATAQPTAQPAAPYPGQQSAPAAAQPAAQPTAPPAAALSRPIRGSLLTLLLFGTRRTRGTLPARLTRLAAGVLPWLLVVALTLQTQPRLMLAAPLLAFLGSLLGRGLYAARPATPWARAVVVAGVPLLLAAPLIAGAQRPGEWTVGAAFLVGAEIGAHLGELRERVVSPPARVLRREFRGVTRVGTPGGISFDVRPLVRRASRAEVAAFARSLPGAGASPNTGRVLAIAVVTAVFPIGILAMGYGMTQEALAGNADRTRQLLGMSAVLSLMLLGGAILVWWVTRARARLTPARAHLAFSRFAATNGFAYLPAPARSPDGSDVLTRTLRSAHAGPAVLIANRESAGDGAGRTHFGGVCALQLPCPLPNIQLRSTRNALPAWSSYRAPARSQRLSLEGDFDRYFEMSVPRGYERDALYLFTPDVLAWLIDDVDGFDVELIDSALYLRSRRDAVTRDPADWQRLALALSALRGRIGQWAAWRDDRAAASVPAAATAHGAGPDLPAPGSDLPSPGPDLPVAGSRLEQETRGPAVAAGGRRLRLGIGAGTVLAVTFGAIYLTLTLLANTIG